MSFSSFFSFRFEFSFFPFFFFKPENGVCEVHVLGDTPIQIRENHFAKPLERNDILNAPAHLPVPKIRFSIRQISIVWYIYGGSDFAQPKPSKNVEQKTFLCL